MMFQRKQALTEQRQRITHAARRMWWIDTIKDEYKISIHIELTNTDVRYVNEMQHWIDNLISNKITFYSSDCNVISDQLYESIAENYPGCNIEITVGTGNSGVTIYYKTHTAIQKIAI